MFPLSLFFYVEDLADESTRQLQFFPPQRHNLSNLAGFVAVYMTVC